MSVFDGSCGQIVRIHRFVDLPQMGGRGTAVAESPAYADVIVEVRGGENKNRLSALAAMHRCIGAMGGFVNLLSLSLIAFYPHMKWRS